MALVLPSVRELDFLVQSICWERGRDHHLGLSGGVLQSRRSGCPRSPRSGHDPGGGEGGVWTYPLTPWEPPSGGGGGLGDALLEGQFRGQKVIFAALRRKYNWGGLPINADHTRRGLPWVPRRTRAPSCTGTPPLGMGGSERAPRAPGQWDDFHRPRPVAVPGQRVG